MRTILALQNAYAVAKALGKSLIVTEDEAKLIKKKTGFLPELIKVETGRTYWRCSYCGHNKNNEADRNCQHCGRREE